LILSTPITVCLLVAGRHMKGLGILELLFRTATPLNLTQKLYPEGPHEIVNDAQFRRRTRPTHSLGPTRGVSPLFYDSLLGEERLGD
jgi:hypothetical protein